jgi:hypothetical protein
MGNIFKKEKFSHLNDSRRLLLNESFDVNDFQLKNLEKKYSNLSNSYNNIVKTYTQTISDIREELCLIKNKNAELNKLVKTNYLISEENSNKIKFLENKILSLSSDSQFLSNVDLED